MRKSLIILFAVALLGGGVYAKEHNNPGASSGSASSAASSNISTASDNSSVSSTPGSSANSSSSGSYKDGKYTGSTAETPYGTVQIAVVVSGGKIIDMVSGATSTSYGYQESLQAALDKAKIS
jgi:uncharacterized protein with FMN-binding domain